MNIVEFSQQMLKGLQYLTTQEPAFFVIGLLIILSAIFAVRTSKLVHSALGLLSCFSSIALLYFYLEAYFVGISQILIYAVGIVLIILFAIMILSDVSEQMLPVDYGAKASLRDTLAFISSIGLFITFAVCMLNSQSSFQQLLSAMTENRANTGIFSQSLWQLGEMFMTEQLLAFELISIVLLVALVGAILIARRTSTEEQD